MDIAKDSEFKEEYTQDSEAGYSIERRFDRVDYLEKQITEIQNTLSSLSLAVNSLIQNSEERTGTPGLVSPETGSVLGVKTRSNNTDVQAQGPSVRENFSQFNPNALLSSLGSVPYFTGENYTRSKALKWLGSLEDWADVVKVPSDEMIKYVPFRLDNGAHKWFKELQGRITREKLDWFSFREQFKERFVKPMPSQDLRMELMNLCQKDDLQSYINTFESLCSECSNLNDEEKIHYFVIGLKSSIRAETECFKFELLRDGQLAYESVRDKAIAIYMGQKASSGKSIHGQEPVKGGIQRPSRRFVYHTKFKKPAGNKESSNSQVKDGKMNQQDIKISYAKLTPAEKQEIIDKKGCLYCRELNVDHIAANCPKKLQKSKAQPLNN